MLWFALLCLVALAVWWCCARHRRSRCYELMSRIPGPRGVPLLGNTLEANRNIGRVVEFGREQRRQHGATFGGWLGPFPFAVLCDPRDVEIVLNRSATLSKSLLYKVPELFLGYSLLTAGRSDWKRFHKITSPAFRNPVLESFLPAINDKSRVLVSVLRCHQDGQVFDVLNYMKMCTLDIVTETSLGTSMDVLNNNRVELVQGLRHAEDVVFHAFTRPWCWNSTFMKKTSAYKSMVKGVQVLWDFADDIVNKKLSYHSTEEKVHRSSEKKSMGFLDHVISCMKAESSLLSKTELVDNTMTVIVGGTDTAAFVMSAALMLLGLHQDVQEKVVEELEQIFGEDINRPATTEDMKQMVYLEQVLNETMRLYPPLPIVSRIVEEEINITGYTLPVGTILLIPPYLIHREAGYFPDPDKFDPDRFSPENSVGRHPYSFIPFLGGRRMCVGKKYAYMQMKTIMAILLRNYKVLPYGSRNDIEKIQFRVTLHIVSGSKIKLVSRRL